MTRPTDVVGRRIGAFFIDLFIYAVVGFAIFMAMASTEEEQLEKISQGDIGLDDTLYGNVQIGDSEYSLTGSDFGLYVLITWVLLPFLYYAVLQGLTGWTLGKLITGVRVVDEQGQVGGAGGVGRNAIRWLCLVFIDSAPWFLPYIVGFVCILATDKKRRVGDMLAKTAVVGKEHVGQNPYPEMAGAYGGMGGWQQPGGLPAQGAAQAQGGGNGAGWHPDPRGEARLRYWDGSQWTEHTTN